MLSSSSRSRSDMSMWIERHEDDPVEPGEPITGTVHVETTEDCTCQGLLLRLEWYTHGRGNLTSQDIDLQFLFEGEWTAGEHYEYDFEMSLPPGPYTYHGEYLNVDWRLKAIAKTDWSVTPEAMTDVLLVPSGTEKHFRAGDQEIANAALASEDDQTVSWLRVAGGFFFLIPAFLVIGRLLHLYGSGAPVVLPSLWTVFLTMVSVLASAGMFYPAIQNVPAEMRLGTVDVHLPPEGSPGDRLRCRVSMEPFGTVELDEITVRLYCYEKVVDTHGGMTPEDFVYTHTVHNESTSIRRSQQATLRKGSQTFETDIELPDSAPYSFYAEDNELKWHLQVHIDLPWWPDWSHTEPLTVRPSPT